MTPEKRAFFSCYHINKKHYWQKPLMKNIMFPMILLSMALLLAGCTGQPQQPPQQNATPTAQYGDLVSVDYTLRVDGTVVDTSLADAARQAGTFNSSRSYQPISFRLMLGGQMIDGFVKGMVGMKQGETKNFTVSAADGYGLPDPQKIITLPRYHNMSVFEEVPMDYFIAQNISVREGAVFPTSSGNVGIENYTNDTVTLRYLFSSGHQFAVNGIPETVVSIANDTMLISLDFQENGTYTLTDPQTGTQSFARATYADNDFITLDENNPLAGKDLDFQVTLRSLAH
jgi:FKBP-type peptidyl-prolyl cis-trans isomerase 2